MDQANPQHYYDGLSDGILQINEACSVQFYLPTVLHLKAAFRYVGFDAFLLQKLVG